MELPYNGETMPPKDIIGYQIKCPVPCMGYLLLSYWLEGSNMHHPPKLQAATIALGIFIT